MRSARRLRGLSVAELSQRIARHVHTVYVWEQGKRLPDVADVVAISQQLDVDMRWLMTGRDEFAPAGIDTPPPREAVA